MTNPGGPQLLGMDAMWLATLLSVVAGINVLLEQRRACEVYSEARQEVRQAQG